MTFASLISRLPSGLAQGIIYGLMALGIYITYKVLKVSDLTVDGSFATGGAVAVMVILKGYGILAALLLAFIAGCLTGMITGLLHTKLKIPVILASILTQIALYSINLKILENNALKSVNVDAFPLLVNVRYLPKTIIIVSIIAVITIALMYWFFGTEQGCSIRATGDNNQMALANGININFTKVIGLSLSNGIVGFAGALMAQYQGFADVNMARGAIVIGLAAIIIGEVLCKAIFKKGSSFYTRLLFVIVGGIVYYFVMVLILWLKINSNDLKLFTAIIVAIFLAIPNLKKGSESNA